MQNTLNKNAMSHTVVFTVEREEQISAMHSANENLAFK